MARDFSNARREIAAFPNIFHNVHVARMMLYARIIERCTISYKTAAAERP